MSEQSSFPFDASISFSSSATQSHREATSCSEDVALWSHLQLRFPITSEVLSSNHQVLRMQSRHFFSPTLKTCNSLHSRWIVIDNEEIPCMQSQQFSAHNHGRYNKSAHEGCAVTRTLPTLIHHQLSINRPSSPAKRGMGADCVGS